mgnify:CR=1 FL=1
MQVGQRDTRRADTRRSWCCVRRCCLNLGVIIPARAFPTNTAGSRPRLLVTRPTTVCGYVRNRAGHAIPQATAGSRPPLLVRARVCIAKVAILPADERPACLCIAISLGGAFFELGSGKTLLCIAEVAFSPATERRAPGRRFCASGSAVAWSAEVALQRFEMAIIGQVEMQRGNGDVAFGQGGDVGIGSGL